MHLIPDPLSSRLAALLTDDQRRLLGARRLLVLAWLPGSRLEPPCDTSPPALVYTRLLFGDLSVSGAITALENTRDLRAGAQALTTAARGVAFDALAIWGQDSRLQSVLQERSEVPSLAGVRVFDAQLLLPPVIAGLAGVEAPRSDWQLTSAIDALNGQSGGGPVRRHPAHEVANVVRTVANQLGVRGTWISGMP